MCIESQRQQEQVQQHCQEKEHDRARRELERVQWEAKKESHVAFKVRWTEAIREAGERMQELIKNPLPRAHIALHHCDYIAPFLGILPSICKINMALRLAKRKAQKFRAGDPHNLPHGTSPSWMHRLDPQWVDIRPDSLPNQAQSMGVPPTSSGRAPSSLPQWLFHKSPMPA